MRGLTKQEQNIADVSFIIRELNRFATMGAQEVVRHISANPKDALSTLRGSRGGLVLCGKAAYDRFETIADRTIARGSTEAANFDRRDYLRAMRKAFADVFITNAKPVTQGSVMHFIKRAQERASADLIHVTHHLPCVVFYEAEPDQFAVGPVTFTATARFLAELEPQLHAHRDEHAAAYARGLLERQSELSMCQVEKESTTFADKHLDHIRKYYEQFDWVASIEIPSAHPGVSHARAERTVDAALDVLRLVVPTLPDRYRRAGAPNTPFDTHEIMTDALGQVISSMRQNGRGAPSMAGWYDGIKNDAPNLWEEFERAVGTLTQGDKSDELTQRLVDALNWFGQAVVETNPAAVIVKYTAGLERLATTGHVSSGLEAMVIRRIAFLNNDRSDKTIEQIKRDLGKLYQLRSDLMHGSLSPYDPSVRGVLRIAWEIGRWSVLRAAIEFRSLRLLQQTSRKDLAAHYDAVAPPSQDNSESN